MQDPEWSFDYFHERVLLVVINCQLTIKRRDFDRVTMNARRGGRDLEINRLGVVATQIEFFRFHRAAIFAYAQQNFCCTVTTQANDRLNIQS